MTFWVISTLLTMGWTSSGLAGESVELTWDPNVEATLEGYRVHWGITSGTYTGVMDVGNTIEATVPNLVVGNTYFFAVTAYGSESQESPPSDEVAVTILPPRLPVAIGAMERLPDRSLRFTLTAESDLTSFVNGFNVEASSDLLTWGIIAHFAGLAEPVVFIDLDAAFVDRRFYRVSAFKD